MQINMDSNAKGIRPIVFSTLINPEFRRLFKTTSCVFFDFFDTFISRLESELSMQSSHTFGRYHGLVNDSVYNVRIEAMNYASTLMTASRQRTTTVPKSYCSRFRSGKTPTCLYLGMQFGIYAAITLLRKKTC